MEGSRQEHGGQARHVMLLVSCLALLILLPLYNPVLAQDDASRVSEADSWGEAGQADDAAAGLGNPPPPPVEPSAEGLQALRHESALPVDGKLNTVETLAGILARPEFQQDPLVQQPRQETWWDRLLKQVQQWLARLGMGAVAGSNTATIVATVLLAALLALLVYLLVRWIWDAVSSGRVSKVTPGEKHEDELEPELLLKLAQAALARGEVRQAIRLRFKAVLRRLPQTSAAVLLTNSQLKRRLAREYPAAAQPFGRLVVCFEDCWYGGLPVAGEDYRTADGWARAVEEAIPLSQETGVAA